MATSAVTDYGALSALERLIGFLVCLATSIFILWVKKDKSGIASTYVGQAQKISIIATAVFLVIIWGFWANSTHLTALSVAAAAGIVTCFLFYLLNIFVVENAKVRLKTVHTLAFIATYVIYTFSGSSGLSSAGLFVIVVLGNPANSSAAVNANTYQVSATLHGTRNVTENQTVPFSATSGQMNVGCNETTSASVHWQLPPGARVEAPIQPRWEATDNVKAVEAPPAASLNNGVVTAQGTITGLDRQNFAFGISNCPGGGHGQLVIHGQYVASVSHTQEQPAIELRGQVNSKDRVVTLAIPNSPDFHVTSGSVKLLEENSKQAIDTAEFSVTTPELPMQEKSAHGKFAVILSGQNLKIDLL